MNRTEGFPNADVDTGLLHDPKVIALSRRLRDPQATATHVLLYQALVLESWSRGDRATLEEAAPAWWFEPLDEIAANLAAVGMVDAESRIPSHAWEAWFRPAWERREKRRSSGAEGGRRSWDKRRRSDAEPTPNPSVLPTGRPAGPQAEPADRDAQRAETGSEAGPTLEVDCYRCDRPLDYVHDDVLVRATTVVERIDDADREIHVECATRPRLAMAT